MSSSGTNNSERLVSCSFCDEKHQSSVIGEHLMTCGNKTDQCPNCRKYIRRAVFAYHYENNCAILDESDADVRATSNPPNASSTFQPNFPPLSLSGLAAENNKDVPKVTHNLATHSKPETVTSPRLDSDFCETKRTITLCSFCKQQCEIGERDIHQKNCLQNPDNIAKRYRSRNNPTPAQNSNQLNHVDESNVIDDIPCEYCNEPIKWCDFHDHTKACATRHYQRLQEQSQHANTVNNTTYARCKYCDQEYMRYSLEQHERYCTKDPVNVASEERYRTVFCLPLPNIRFF